MRQEEDSAQAPRIRDDAAPSERAANGFDKNDSYGTPQAMQQQLEQLHQQLQEQTHTMIMQLATRMIAQMLVQHIARSLQDSMSRDMGQCSCNNGAWNGGCNLDPGAWNGTRQVDPRQRDSFDPYRRGMSDPNQAGAYDPRQRGADDPYALRGPAIRQGGPLAQTRQRFAQELQNPAVRERLMQLTKAEVGGQGAAAELAFIESTMNRASARRKSLMATMNDPGYFPRRSLRQHSVSADSRATYASLINRALAGSNVANFATGNESGSVTSGRARHGPNWAPITRNFGSGRERFVIEHPDLAWANAVRGAYTQQSTMG